MYKGRRVIVVVPAHNEERFIGQVIATMPHFVDRIIVVDDCSTDGTSRAAAATGDGRVLVLRTPTNQGVGGAMKLGYRTALELGGELMAKMDGDGQMPPEYLSVMLDALVDEGYSYVKANRFLHGRSLAAMPKMRLFGNIVLTFLTKAATGYWHIFDPENGFHAIKGECLRQFDFDKMNRGYFFENDMLFQVALTEAPARDVAMPARYGAEESSLSLMKVGLTFPFLLLCRFFQRIYQRHVLRDFSPIALFLLLGLLLFGWGSGFGAYLWIKSAVTGQPTLTGAIMLSVLPLILGFQLLLQALVLDIQDAPRAAPARSASLRAYEPELVPQAHDPGERHEKAA